MTFTAAELLALAPTDLRDLLEAPDGTFPGVHAAELGLDLTIPEHLAAFLAAFPEIQDPNTSDPEPDVDALVVPDSGVNPFDGPAELAEHMHVHRGSGQPFLAGTFALYAAADGSVVMVTETDQAGVRRDVMPARVVKLALGFAAGTGQGTAGMLGRLLRRG